MALTLIEAAGYIQDSAQRALVELYASATPLLGALPFMDAPQGTIRFPREGNLPDADFRALNAAYTESSGNVEWVREECFNLGGDVDVDVRLARTGQIDLRAQQEAMQVKAVAQVYDRAFVKGDAATDADSFTGLQVRLGSGSQVLANQAGTNDGIDLNKLDALIDLVEEPTHLYMTKAIRRRISQATRNSSVGGYVTYQQDQFGRQVMLYNDLPILIADPFGHRNAPLAFDEGNNTTSVYCLSLREGGLMGIQVAAPDIRDLGEIDTKPVERSRIEWYCGLAMFSPRAAARLTKIDDTVAS